jgi:hypothetical protein
VVLLIAVALALPADLQTLSTAALLLLPLTNVCMLSQQEYKAKLVAEGKFLAPTVPLSPAVNNSLKMVNERTSDVASESLKALRQTRRTSVLQTAAANSTAAAAAGSGGAATATAAGGLSSPQGAGSVQLTAVVAPEDALHASPGAMRRASRMPAVAPALLEQHRSSSAGMRHVGSAPSMGAALNVSSGGSAAGSGGRRMSALPSLGEGSFDGLSAGAGPVLSSPSGASARRTSVLVSPTGLSSSASSKTAGSQRGSVTAVSGSSRRASVVAGAAGNRRASQAPVPAVYSGSSSSGSTGSGLVPTRSSVKLSAAPIVEGVAQLQQQQQQQQQQQSLVSPSSASSRRKSTAVHVPGALFAGMEVYDQQQQQQAAARRRSSKVVPPLAAAAAGRRMSTSPVRA